MLTDSTEIKIISKAIQKNVRDPNRSRIHFEHIFKDFFYDQDFKGKNFLDLGPGQFDFGMLVKEKGGFTYGIDKDPAVVELGNYKNFPTINRSLEELNNNDFDLKFDGVFCKYSIDAFWFSDEKQHGKFLKELFSLIKPGGWAWIAPWNGNTKELTNEEINRILKYQLDFFISHGFMAVELSQELTKYYGVHGNTANCPLFCLNLKKPYRLKNSRQLDENYIWPGYPSKNILFQKYLNVIYKFKSMFK